MKLNCIAIDDEPLALGLIRSFIEQTPFLQLKGAFSNALEVLPVLQKESIHLLFLDIQMPEINGIQFSKLLQQSARQHHFRIIFTTAFDQFAIEGYRVDALFYLLKPFSYEEFLEAAWKGLDYFQSRTSKTIEPTEEEKSIFIKSDYKTIRIDLESIRYIESLRDYIKIHLVGSNQPIRSLMNLKIMEDRLPSSRFLRIHRSFIVNIHHIDAIGKNALQVAGLTLPIGEQYKRLVEELRNKWQ